MSGPSLDPLVTSSTLYHYRECTLSETSSSYNSRSKYNSPQSSPPPTPTTTRHLSESFIENFHTTPMSSNTDTTSSKSVITAPAYYNGIAGDFLTFVCQNICTSKETYRLLAWTRWKSCSFSLTCEEEEPVNGPTTTPIEGLRITHGPSTKTSYSNWKSNSKTETRCALCKTNSRPSNRILRPLWQSSERS